MATTYNTDIQKLYVAYFNRPADPAGLAYWEGVVEASNGDTASVSASFAASAEYSTAYSGMTNAQIVNQVYENLFGRAADAPGSAYWAGLLNSGSITVDGVVTAVAGGAQGTDASTYANKVSAATAFTGAVDTTAEMAGYTGAGNAVAKTWLSSITDSASLTAAIAPAALNTTVANVVAAGTTFTVTGTLASLDAANTALDTYIASVDVDGNPATDTTDASQITAAYTASLTDVAGMLTSGTGAQALFVAPGTSDSVRTSLLNAQEAINSASLATAQGQLTAANTAISKVSGLSGAESTLTAATAAEAAANKTLTAANADLAAKEASFDVTFAGNVALSTDGTQLLLTPTDTTKPAVVLATIGTSGTATITTSSTVVSSHAGLADLITSYNAQHTAANAVLTAHSATETAQDGVNNLDVDMTDMSSGSEASLLTQVTASMNAYIAANHAGAFPLIATGSFATEAQIETAKAIIDVNGDATTKANFDTLVTSYETAAAASNPLTANLTTATAAVKTANDTISDLADAVSAMTTAEQSVSTLAGYQATVKAATDLLTSHGYAVAPIDAATEVGSAMSDIFMVTAATPTTSTIQLFGLQGADSLFVGSGYTMVAGAIGATGVHGSNTALEVFVSQSGADTVLQIETHAYSSAVVGSNADEVITVTLTGVDSTTLHLNNGIISTASATTA